MTSHDLQCFSLLQKLKESFFKRLTASAIQMGIWRTEVLDYRDVYPDASRKEYSLKGG